MKKIGIHHRNQTSIQLKSHLARNLSYIAAVPDNYDPLYTIYMYSQSSTSEAFTALDKAKNAIAQFESASHVLCVDTVSYTHLTLPTILLVQISVVAVSLKKKKNKFT
eukprot:TRINITY_DN9835_c0_g1_i2.p5 TRINITY_DN9835_c0_g1~~TRINITY_DN9835_c0_g1_i2.p5  ORF type:complete len:108 (-),score=17.13 TRINITY_DN9835_c0_g1_i2:98-421(-)